MRSASLAATVMAALASTAFAPGATRGTVVTPFASEARTSAAQPGLPAHQQPGSRDGQFLGDAWRRLRYSRQRRAGPGWTNRHVQRMARKARNVRRARAAARG